MALPCWCKGRQNCRRPAKLCSALVSRSAFGNVRPHTCKRLPNRLQEGCPAVVPNLQLYLDQRLGEYTRAAKAPDQFDQQLVRQVLLNESKHGAKPDELVRLADLPDVIPGPVPHHPRHRPRRHPLQPPKQAMTAGRPTLEWPAEESPHGRAATLS